jgi:hypothetical protein
MIPNLKAIASTVLAITAMTAVVASSASAAAFTGAGGKNAIITAEQTVATEVRVDTGIIKCTGLKFPAATVTNGSTTVTVHPEYSGCKAFGVNASVSTTGCNYVLHLEAGGATKTAIVCSGTNVIKVTPVGLDCTVTIDPNGYLGGVLENDTPHLKLRWTISNLHYIEHGTNCIVPGTITGTDGVLSGTLTIRGFEDSVGAEGAALAISADV